MSVQLEAQVDWSDVESLEARTAHVCAVQLHRNDSLLVCFGQVTPPIAVKTEDALGQWLEARGGKITVHHGVTLALTPLVARDLAQQLEQALKTLEGQE